MNKEHILEEIKRTAKAHRGVPLGVKRFSTETGIKPYDWGKFWVRWGEALCEAGFTPNQMQKAFSETLMIEKFIELTRELGRLPVAGDIRIKGLNVKNFPSMDAFQRFGSKQKRISEVREYCQKHQGYDDVLLLCGEDVDDDESEQNGQQTNGVQHGYVYLFKHGSRREYKIGKTLNPLRREGEIALQLPEKLEPIHNIQTDDPSGIERYWHTRFADKRRQGEWFALSTADIHAFKKWKRIY